VAFARFEFLAAQDRRPAMIETMGDRRKLVAGRLAREARKFNRERYA
jgi:hypothetical protein